MHSWHIPGVPSATLVYPNQDRKFLYEDIVDTLVEDQDGRVVCGGQCFFTGQRVLGLAFCNEEGRDIACSGLAQLTPDFKFPEHGGEGDLGCDHCPLMVLCNDVARSACPCN